MKNIKRLLALVLALILCLSATVAVSAAEVNTVDGSILEFKPLTGDVNIDGYLNLKDVVRYKKYLVNYDAESVIDEEVADLTGDAAFNTNDLVSLQDAVIAKLFG